MSVHNVNFRSACGIIFLKTRAQITTPFASPLQGGAVRGLSGQGFQVWVDQLTLSTIYTFWFTLSLISTAKLKKLPTCGLVHWVNSAQAGGIVSTQNPWQFAILLLLFFFFLRNGQPFFFLGFHYPCRKSIRFFFLFFFLQRLWQNEALFHF